jgi:group II intron reverse transcriptase/maturase
MPGVSEPTSVSTKLERIAELARQAPKLVLHSLAHHVDLEWMREAYARTRQDGARGVDGVSAEEFSKDLDANLRTLREALMSGTYRAPPVRRVHIPKGNGKTRPIGVPTFEDKVLQRAVAMGLEEVYEQDFLDCSYGFRRGRSAHQALDALWRGLMDMGGGFVVELDIKSFFDTMVHGQLRSFLDQRIRDGVMRRAIDKWLAAGVLENGWIHHPQTGTPQGGVISPLLANIYLHEVLDLWFEYTVKPRLHGRAFMIRYADDAVLAFSSEADARRVLEVLPKRFAKYGLALHPEKTRLVEFRRPPPNGTKGSGSFDLLGFTHYWARSRKGRWVVKRKTASQRLGRAVRRVWEWCRDHRHRDVREQHATLSLMVRGHYGYYGITGNADRLSAYVLAVCRAWRYWLDRRSQRARMTWDRFPRLLQRYPLPRPRVVHSIYVT